MKERKNMHLKTYRPRLYILLKAYFSKAFLLKRNIDTIILQYSKYDIHNDSGEVVKECRGKGRVKQVGDWEVKEMYEARWKGVQVGSLEKVREKYGWVGGFDGEYRLGGTG